MKGALLSNFEAKLILNEVKDDDRVVYLGSCACIPLARDIARKVRKRGRLVVAGRAETLNNRKAWNSSDFRMGTHEQIPVEDGWATLVVGECILDEFRKVGRAFSQFSRILAPGGMLVVSGPVHPADAHAPKGGSITSDATGLLTLGIVKDQLNRTGFAEIHIKDLSRQASKAMKSTNRFQRLADSLSEKTRPVVFLFVKAIRV